MWPMNSMHSCIGQMNSCNGSVNAGQQHTGGNANPQYACTLGTATSCVDTCCNTVVQSLGAQRYAKLLLCWWTPGAGSAHLVLVPQRPHILPSACRSSQHHSSQSGATPAACRIAAILSPTDSVQDTVWHTVMLAGGCRCWKLFKFKCRCCCCPAAEGFRCPALKQQAR